MKSEVIFHRVLSLGLVVALGVLGSQYYTSSQASPATAQVVASPESPTDNNPVAPVKIGEIEEDLKIALSSGEEIVYFNGKSWVGYEGKPLNLTILNDKTCGQECETNSAVATLKNVLTH